MDRRLMFTTAAAAGLLAASGVSPERQPVTGGHLRVAVPRDDQSLERLARAAAFDTLTEIAPDGTLRGELATGWKGSPDARRWRLDLRDKVTFHDGGKLGAADVVASLTAHDPAALSGARLIEATHPARLLVELDAPNPHLPYYLSDPDLFICRDGQIGAALEQGFGTGCYRTLRSQPDRQFLGRRIADHYKSGRAGWADRFEVIVIPDAEVRAEAVRDSFVDIAVLPRPDSLRTRSGLIFHPSAQNMALAAREDVGIPRQIGKQRAMDDGRLAERWWKA